MIRSTHPLSAAALEEICQTAIAALDEGLEASAGQQAEPIARAERAVNQIRDEFIERLRHPAAGEDLSNDRENLERANISLSLIAGVEFPAGAVHKKKLRHARKVLKKVEKSLPNLSEPEA